ncbi:MAG: lipoyl synthase [Elusimicrobia bacterium GWA2_69_24]|nr:MAG: lipoyl synthase [Elusimicrobia bacterium GWA2_69_24]HBL17969.1 lipoyl synthase [Elusimicrobiota bacterium]
MAGLPPWLKVRVASGSAPGKVRRQLDDGGLHTVCEEARCPNRAGCWGCGTATFMVLGDSCTRTCRFCAVPGARRPAAPDPAEPERLARSVAELGLSYAVLTTVCRDDLPDQGAGHIAACVRAIRRAAPGTGIECLIQDFRGDEGCLKIVASAAPDVLGHNLETVERLTPSVRDPRAGYRASLEVLAACTRLAPGIPAKSSLMLGLGETEAEAADALRDLRAAGVGIVTLGQYLRPSRSPRHLPVAEYVTPERFERWRTFALDLGFSRVASGPLVRSSYRAGELLRRPAEGRAA